MFRHPTAILATFVALLLCVSALWRSSRSAVRSSAQPVAAVATITTKPAATDAPVADQPAAPQRRIAVGEVVTEPGVLPARYAVPSQAENYLRATPWAATLPREIAVVESGSRLEFPLFDGRVMHGEVQRVFREASGQRIVSGVLAGPEQGTFAFGVSAGEIGGHLQLAGAPTTFVVETGRDGRAWLVERPLSAVVCVELPDSAAPAAAEGTGTVAAAETAGSEYLLSSRPTATAVLYIDFDGESVTDPLWNNGATIDATPSGLSAAQIVDTWRRVSEDYRPFNVDVTTNRARYDAAPVKSRMRCIVTQNSAWYGAYGGVAYIGSWRNAGGGSYSSTIPCWVFSNNLAMAARYVAEAISHEAGHTLGLSHDGVMDASGATTAGYYTGHSAGNTGWAPIMGVGYYQSLVQWSKGEYVPPGGGFANNTEDDLTIISSASNNFGYVADNAGADLNSPAALRFSAPGVVSTIGTIETTGDADCFAFTTAGGAVNFTFSPEVTGDEGVALTNLDAQATLYDSTGAIIATSNPGADLFPNLSATIAAGTYYLTVVGVGQGGLSDGYTNYGSIGRYAIGGSVPYAAVAPVVVGPTSLNLTLGSALNAQIEATGEPTSYAASGLPAGTAVNTTTGLLSGTPTAAGTFAVTLSATNSYGTGSKVITLSVASVLGTALESLAQTWNTGGGNAWAVDTNAYHDGASSARSGSIGANGTSWLETTVVGAGSLSFWWKVSSEANGDYLRFLVDGVEVTKISGAVAWTQYTYAVAAGTHTLRWNYTKNSKTNSGSDAGWLDGVTYTKTLSPPVITSSTSARCIVGVPFTYQITATNSPTGFSASGLPAGLTVDNVTGVISGSASATAARGLMATTISASNNGGTGSTGFSLEVATPFVAWTEDSGLSGASMAASADPDGDGVINLLEYAFGRSAATAEATNQSLPQTQLRDDAGTPRLEATFLIPANRTDLVYTVQVSGDLVTWTAGHAYGTGIVNGAGLPTQEISRTPVTGGEQIVVRDIAGTSSPARYLRIVVQAQ